MYLCKSIRALISLGNFNKNKTLVHLKCFRKYSSVNLCDVQNQIAKEFRYQYESSELVEKLKSLSKCDEISSASSIKIANLLDFWKSQKITSEDDIQAIITSLILAAKLDENVEVIVPKALGEFALSRFLVHLDDCIEQMSVNDVVSSLVALHLLNIPLHHPVNRKLVIRISNMLKDLKEFPLESLSNLAIFSRENETSFFPYIFCANGTSHILKYLEECKNIEQLNYVTIYLDNLPQFLTKDIMALHKKKAKLFLDEMDRNNIDHKKLLTLMKFYRSTMMFKNSRIIRNMLFLMSSNMSQLNNTDLRNVAWTRDWINEPASLIPEILKIAESRPNKSTDIDLVYCRLYNQLPEYAETTSKDLLNIVENMSAKDITINDILTVAIKNKRFVNAKIVHQKYWDKVFEDLNNINSNELEKNIDKFIGLAHRYCTVQKTMRNRYRNQKFETLLRDLALVEIKYGVSAWIPSRIGRLASFIIGFATDPVTNYVTLPEYFVEKIESIGPQLTFTEIISISNGIETFNRIGLPKTLNRRTAAQIVDRIARLDNVLNQSIERIIDERSSIQIDAICLLIRACSNQKAPKKTRIIEKLTKKLEEMCDSDDVIITPRTIQLATGSLKRISYVVPKLSEKMLTFINENMDIVGADTAASLLFYLFSMGYDPYSQDANTMLTIESKQHESTVLRPDFDFANFFRIINRDFEFIPAWSIIRACLALSFYQVLTLDLIQRVFNMEFVTRLEKELSLTYDTKIYPTNVLNLVMQLNRSVCLSYPEAGVPWFQQSFIEGQLAADPPKATAYFNDIYRLLVSFVGGDKSMIRTNHITPYGYRIPFVIYFNSDKQLVPPPFDEGPQSLNKVAILPLLNKSFRFGDSNELRGFDRLQERHLSMLGYNVIQICYREWNSIHMNLPGARENFLRQFLKKYNSLTD